MIKQLVHKVFTVGLALIVLFSTISFTIEKHFCGDTLVDVALFSQGQDCAGNVNNSTVKKKTCCKDEITVIEGQNELIIKAFNDLELEQQYFVYSIAYAHLNLFEGLSQQVVPNKDYSPPNLILDIQLLDQVFLI